MAFRIILSDMTVETDSAVEFAVALGVVKMEGVSPEHIDRLRQFDRQQNR